MKLYKAMFDTLVLKKIFATMFRTLFIVGAYALVVIFLVSSAFSGGQNFGQIVIILLLSFFSLYGVFVFLPLYLFLKYSYESTFYIKPLALAYGIDVSTSVVELPKKKERRKIAMYLFASALFLFVISVFFLKEKPYMIVVGLVPFYVMIYKNWIQGVSFALGEPFMRYYKEHRSQYLLRGAGFILLMHIPLSWFFQPWILQALSEMYLKDAKRQAR